MQQREITISNKLGLHARAAAKLVKVAGGFGARITLTRDDREIDAKSIMSVLLLAAAQGTVLEVRTEGNDEEAAMSAIVDLIDDKFGEGE